MDLVESPSRSRRPSSLIRMSFNLLARPYRGMELFLAGNLLQHCRTAFLAEAASCESALLCGEGPGRYLVELAKANPRARVTCVDSSAGMIAMAKRHLRAAGLSQDRIEFEHGDLLAWRDFPGRFDWIATHFFLDCFTAGQLAEVIGRIATAARPDAGWVLSDFCVPGRGWRRWRAQAILRLAYLFFRLTTNLSTSRLIAPDAFLEAHGFRLCQRRIYNHGLLHADLWRRAVAAPQRE
jgi:SAM-dependent methyltransferase